MIRPVLILVFIAFAYTGIAQNSFIQTVEDFSLSSLYGVFSADDNFVTYGIYIDSTGSRMARKTDSSGNTLWTWKALDYTMNIYCGAADGDGNIYLCRYRSSLGPRLLKLSPEGDSIWQKPLPGNQPISISRTHDDLFLLLSHAGNGLIFSKTDLSGDVIWSKQISNIDLDDERNGLTHFEMSDSAILIITQSSEPLFGDYITYFQLFSQAGDSLSEFSFPVYGPQQIVYSAFRLNDHEVALTGKYQGEYNVDQRFVSRINVLSGEVVWYKTVLQDILNARLLIAGVSENRIMISGNIQNTVNMPLQALSMGMTLDGDVLFYRGYGVNILQDISSVCLAADGGIVAAGHTYSGDKMKGFIMKTDHNGMVNVLGTGSVTSRIILNCYPNPVVDRLCIETSAGIRLIELFDAKGRKTGQTECYGNKKIMLPMNAQRPGLLLVRVVHDQGVDCIKVMVR